jgi:hypothetical protein
MTMLGRQAIVRTARRWAFSWIALALFGMNTGFAVVGFLFDKPLYIVVNGSVAALLILTVRDAVRDASSSRGRE